MTEWKIGDISIIVPVLGFAFFIQLFSAEIVFLSLYGRRERFILRFIPTIAAELVLVWIYYNLEPFLTFVFGGSDSTFAVETVEFIRYIVIISLTIAGMTVCFDEQLPSIIMACTAGYALQHFAYKLQTFVGAFFSIYDAVGRSYLLFSLVSTLIFFIPSYIIAWFIFVNPIRKNKWDYNGSSFLNVCSFLIVLLLVFINRFSDNSTPSQAIINSLYGMTCSAFALIIQFAVYHWSQLKTEHATMQVVLQENEKQYEQWKAGMEDINIKYHDLRHEIEFLKENRVQSLVLEKAEKALDDYGSVVRTGNDMLDVLLTGKKLICRREKVQFICVVDGELFGGFDSSKLYSLLNNALDNAIECAGKFADEQKRFVSLTVRRVGMFISVNVSNRCEDKIEFYDGLPAPGKKGGWHGYGVKSMKRITELLGGAISASLTDNMFNLDILLPVPQ